MNDDLIKMIPLKQKEWFTIVAALVHVEVAAMDALKKTGISEVPSDSHIQGLANIRAVKDKIKNSLVKTMAPPGKPTGFDGPNRPRGGRGPNVGPTRGESA